MVGRGASLPAWRFEPSGGRARGDLAVRISPAYAGGLKSGKERGPRAFPLPHRSWTGRTWFTGSQEATPASSSTWARSTLPPPTSPGCCNPRLYNSTVGAARTRHGGVPQVSTLGSRSWAMAESAWRPRFITPQRSDSALPGCDSQLTDQMRAFDSEITESSALTILHRACGSADGVAVSR